MKLPGLTSVLFFLTLSHILVAQSSADDSLLYTRAVKNVVNIYYQSSGDQSWLYNGSQYGGFLFTFQEGHAFLSADMPGRGSIVYEGILYDGVLLQYDEIQEKVIMEDTARRIQLLNDKISRFSLFGNSFVRIVKDSLSAALVSSGFYNLLYEGNTSVLKKEIKTIREEITSQVITYFADSHEYYYIKKGNVYYTAGSKKKMLNILSDHKKEIQLYIRKNKLNYRKDRDNTLIKVMAYYNQLTA